MNEDTNIDFNQAMDARLVNEENAKLLAQIKWIGSRIRFGCDTKPQIAECQRAIDLITQYGFRGEFFLYTMLHGDFQECYNRINYWRQKLVEARTQHTCRPAYAYAQPYRDPLNPNSIIPQWQKDLAGWCNKRMMFWSFNFEDFQPRKGFKCSEYFK